MKVACCRRLICPIIDWETLACVVCIYSSLRCTLGCSSTLFFVFVHPCSNLISMMMHSWSNMILVIFHVWCGITLALIHPRSKIILMLMHPCPNMISVMMHPWTNMISVLMHLRPAMILVLADLLKMITMNMECNLWWTILSQLYIFKCFWKCLKSPNIFGRAVATIH